MCEGLQQQRTSSDLLKDVTRQGEAGDGSPRAGEGTGERSPWVLQPRGEHLLLLQHVCSQLSERESEANTTELLEYKMISTYQS